MLSFLFLLILFFILWPLLKGLFRVGYQTWRISRFMRDPEGEFRRRTGFGQQRQAPREPEMKRKKITRDVGEYVEFQERELTVDEKLEMENGATESTRTHVVEEQITDVKWVDLEK